MTQENGNRTEGAMRPGLPLNSYCPWLQPIILLVLLTRAFSAEDSNFDLYRPAFEGIDTLSVQAVDIAPEIEQRGWGAAQIRNRAVLALRQAGVPVHLDTTASNPFLTVQVYGFRQPQSGMWAYTVEFELLEALVVCRRGTESTAVPVEKGRVMAVTTWSARHLGICFDSSIPETLRGKVTDMAESFAVLYQRYKNP